MTAPERGPAGTWQYLLAWDGGIATGASLAGMPADETAAARLIKAERGGDGLHYTATSGVWHVWSGRAHEPDTSGTVGHLILDFGARMRIAIDQARGAVIAGADSQLPPNATEAAVRQARETAWAPWKAAEKYAAGLMKAPGQSALLAVLERLCTVADEHLDEHHAGLLNVANGTLNLATLELRPHSRADLITYELNTPWTRGVTCPRFWRLLLGVCGGDYEVASYLVKALGYSLLGDNREQKVFFIAGPSGSGKSVLLHVVSEVLGSLAHRSGSDLICVVRHGRNARTENSIRGKRLVVITETSRFMSIDEAQLKQLTGEPVISVNQHYAKTEIKTPVSWTIWVATNDMPNLVNFDAAMRRRVIVIPGGPGYAEWQMDPHLAAKILSTERQGILNMLASGCAEYNRSGLSQPEAVVDATEMYAVEQNTVTSFVLDTIALGGWSPGGGIPQHQAWEVYQQWARGSAHLTRNEFLKHMRSHPGIGYNSVSRRFEGVAWNEDWASKAGWLS